MTLENAETNLMAFGAKQLRTECYLRRLRIVKKGSDFNDHKLLGIKNGPSKAFDGAGTKRRTRHCIIRLLNVMFSERFAHRVHEIDGRPTRAELDSNQTHASSAFWTDFYAAFVSDQADFSKLNSTLVTFDKCDPGVVVPHDAAKLRDMWKDVSGRYATALANSRVSGMHDNDFFSFCSGEIDVLYMHEWLRVKPGLLESVDGKLPKRARPQTMDISSDSDSDKSGRPKTQNKRCSASPGKPTNDVISDILATLQGNNSSAEALELDCRFAQLVSTLGSLLSLRERIINAPDGSYTPDDLLEVNDDIARVRAKKRALLKA